MLNIALDSALKASRLTDIFKDKASNPDINFHNKKLQELSLRVKLRVK